NAVTAAAIMRRAVMLASAYAAHREAFGRRLDQHPLHQEILRAMTAQADGALHLTMRMAQLLGRIETKEATSGEAAVFRLGIALTKLYTAKQAVGVVSEALECFGGQGDLDERPAAGVGNASYPARYRAAAAVTTRAAWTISSTAIHSSVACACRMSPGP